MVEYLTFDEKDIPTGASLKLVHNCSHLLIATGLKGQLISKCYFGCLHFLPKNEQKQVVK